MGLALRGLTRLAGTRLIDRAGLREPTERLVHRSTRDGFRAAGAVGRTFTAVRRLAQPMRLPARKGRDLFDLTPTDEQQMMREAMRDFAASELRPAAGEADERCAAPAGLLGQSAELGVTGLGVPDELGGAVGERSAVTAVLVAEALAHGDMGTATAIMAPAGVAAAISLWGDADQQSTYLPALVGDAVPPAALALLEPGALFDPFRLAARARPAGDGGYVLSGAKALVPRAAEGELFVVGAELEGRGPALFVVESRAGRISVEPEPAMGVRAAATGRLLLEDVRLSPGALLGDGRPEVYAEAVRRARLAWCALAVGTAQAVLDHVGSYVNERTAFGEPISHRQAVAFNIADIAIELEGMRLATYRAAARADQGKDFAPQAAHARRLCARWGMKIGSDGVGLLGGHGFVKEHPVERWYRDLRAAALMEGGLLV